MNIQEVCQLIERLDATGLVTFEYEDSTTRIALKYLTGKSSPVAPSTPVEGPTKALSSERQVLAPDIGVFYHVHPYTPTALAVAGEWVTTEQVVGYVVSGSELLAVYAPCAGTLSSYAAANQQVVGYGDVLALVTP
ncbi:hypothetical protein DMX11_07915 [Pseudomonas sp. LB-090624]|uniref:hypothetical protein n=1 Tax=Pseudomonas sp. LB-090624 TaxID=2213079 RepID=UPI000D97A85D|nr:hypothetical protein [Pseudomonas sp. LB-090624]PYB78855.1 hypothetical protein DMX11_07915 [Pseudomonas sp. LB-090624]